MTLLPWEPDKHAWLGSRLVELLHQRASLEMGDVSRLWALCPLVAVEVLVVLVPGVRLGGHQPGDSCADCSCVLALRAGDKWPHKARLSMPPAARGVMGIPTPAH